MYGLTYHKDYNKYDLGISHPLLKDKPKKTIDFFKKMGLLDVIKSKEKPKPKKLSAKEIKERKARARKAAESRKKNKLRKARLKSARKRKAA